MDKKGDREGEKAKRLETIVEYTNTYQYSQFKIKLKFDKMKMHNNHNMCTTRC